MGKEEVIERIVNLRVQIAALRLEEKSLLARVELSPREKVMNTVRDEIRVLRTPKKYAKARAKRSYYSRQKLSAKMKTIWASRTPEQRREWALKVAAKKKAALLPKG